MSVEDLPDYHLPRVVLIDHVKLVDLISEITLIGTINKILQIDNISSVDLIDEISLIDEITKIAEIEHITTIDTITELKGVTPQSAGEQIVKGGFETGDLTGWTGEAAVVTEQYHSGAYSVRLYEQYAKQTFASPIPKSLISSFGAWQMATASLSADEDYFEIGYSDGTYTRVIVEQQSWTHYDLLAEVPDGKCVSYIKLQGGTVNQWYGDDVSLVTIAAGSVIDIVKEIVKIDAMPDITVETLPDIIIRDATEPSYKLEVDESGRITVNIGALYIDGDGRIQVSYLPDVVLRDATESSQKLAIDVNGKIGISSIPEVAQSVRTSLKAQTEREDLISLGGVASPNAAGVQIIAPDGTKKIKVYDAEYEALADGLHYFYFGTSTTATTRRFLSRNTAGVNSKTFVQPRVSDAGDGLYLYSAVSETNMPYDVGYVQE